MSLQQIVGSWRRSRFWLVSNPRDLNPLTFRDQPAGADDGQMVPPMGTGDLSGIARAAVAAGYELVGLRFLFEEQITGDPAEWERRMLTAARAGEWNFGITFDPGDCWHAPSVKWLIVRRDGITSAIGRIGQYDAPTDDFFTDVVEPHLRRVYREEKAPQPRRRLRDLLRRRRD